MKFLIILLIPLINLFIGCSYEYLRYKEISVATIIVSFVCGWIMPCFYILEKFIEKMDKLDTIKIIKKEQQ